MDAAITAEGLTRRFGALTAVDGVDFSVPQGEIFGFLGPNGAGKTTTVRMLTGIIEPTEGTATVGGRDVVSHPVAARRGVGIVPEEANVYLDLTVWQNLMLMAELHGVRRAERASEGGALLEAFGLADRRRDPARRLSKGLRQRLMLCTALVARPRVLFLDEPTSGLDVASARLIRRVVMERNADGLTVFLTTHNMAEAEQMCGRVAIIDHGRIVAVDTPDELRKLARGLQSVEVEFAGGAPEEPALASLPGVTDHARSGDVHTLFTARPGELAMRVVKLASETGIGIESIRTCRPSLEDIFLHLTGPESARGGEGDGGGTAD